MKRQILITGATGLVGQRLGIELVKKGFEILVVSRQDPKETQAQLPFPCQAIQGDLSRGPLQEKISPDVVIHLMGENIAGQRWTAEFKRNLFLSRVDSLKNLKLSLDGKPSFLLSASAIGFYPESRGNKIFDETHPKGEGFLSDLCHQWESEARQGPWKKSLALRIGVVLSPRGGALPKMLIPLQFKMAQVLGDSESYLSWIHEEDLVGAILFAIESSSAQKEAHEVLNAVAPGAVTQGQWTKALAEKLNAFEAPSLPAWILKLALGEMSEILLKSQRVSGKKLMDWGYRFQFPDIASCLNDLLASEIKGEKIFQSWQYLPQKREEIFPFFSQARNLGEITPSQLEFKILKVDPEPIQEGSVINYRLKIHGVPVHWQTKILSWQPGVQFVDTQEKGPYSLWHHTHTFESLGEGTLMTDRVRYKLPLGSLGNLLAGWLVRKDIESIFKYRRKVIHSKYFS